MEEKVGKLEKQEGEFFQTLKMNGREIRDMRAKQLGLGAEMAYKSKVDSLFFEVQSLEMEQAAALDLSPDNTFQFIKISDFKPDVFSDKDVEMAVRLRNAKIKFLTAMKRYEKLFGKTYQFDGKEEMIQSLTFNI